MVQNQNITSNPGQSSEVEMSSNTSSSMMEVCGEDSPFFPGKNISSDLVVPPSLNGIPEADQTNLNKMLSESNLNGSLEVDNNRLDNCPEIQTQQDAASSEEASIDNIAYLVENEYPKQVKKRVRNDSTDSVDTLSSASSCDIIFNSEYTDTVSSTASSAYLIKTGADSDVESQDTAYVTETLSHDGYMSYSSTEVLNDDEEEKKEVCVPLTTEDEESETEPMLPNHDESLSLDMTESSNDQSLNDFVHHSLSPIHENQVLIFVEEVEDEKVEEPKFYTKITDNIVVADESFLFNSTSNLGELEVGKGGKRALTMNNLHERSSFLDLTEVSKVGRICQKALIYLKDDMTLGSLASLNTINAKENAKDPSQSISLISGSKSEHVLKKSNYMKNLIALSVSITLLYIAIGSVRNLQSSINHEGGVGVIGLAVNFIGYVVGSMFSSSIVQRFHPRKCVIANLFPNLLYIAANLYPTMWVMIPISLVQGISLAVVSNAVSTYITFLAKGCAEKANAKGVRNFAQISGKFFGIYCLIYQSHIILGNLIASFILEPPGETTDPKPLAALMNSTAGFWPNSTLEGQGFENQSLSPDNLIGPTKTSHLQLCGAGFCQHFEIGGSRFSVELETKILLFGVYIGCIILAVLNAIFFMEPLNKNLFKPTVSPMQSFKSQMSSLMSFFVNIKFLLLLPLLMYSAMQFAFVSAEFMKGYITCPLGIHMIGYTMICFGICSSSSSYICGLLNKQIGRIPFVIAAVVLHVGCLIYMYLWQPSLESLVPYFVVMGVWGVGDGFWNTQISSLMGVIFPTQYEEAYAGLRITQGLSVAVAFGYSSALCMTLKIYITMAVCVIGLVGYLIMEAKHKREQTKCLIELKTTSV